MEQMPKTLLKPNDLKSEVDKSFKILDENVNIGQIKKKYMYLTTAAWEHSKNSSCP